MSFQQRLAAWVTTGFLQHMLLLGLGAGAVLILVAFSSLFFGSQAVRAALPAVDRQVDSGWSEVLGPLSTLPDRYPPVSTNPAARRVEVLAAELGICVAGDPAGPCPERAEQARFTAISTSLTTPKGPVQPADRWLAENGDLIQDLVVGLLTEEPPVWGLALADCRGDLATNLEGQVDLHRVLMAAAHKALRSASPDQASQILEASWRLNEGLIRSPGLDEHLAAIDVIGLQVELLRRLPDPADHWKLRLAATDIQRQALEAYRFDAWRLRCRASSFLANLHPAIGFVASPFARLMAVQQHRAMVFAVDELPRRDVRTFDPDAFVAEQHRLVSRWNPIARSGLPSDWSSWRTSALAALDVELAQRVLDLRSVLKTSENRDPLVLQPRQPSTTFDVDWLYETSGNTIHIALDDTGWTVSDELLPQTDIATSPAWNGGGGRW